MTSLRPFFHREVPHAGNTNTPNVSSCKLKKALDDPNTRWKSTHAANFKLIVKHDEDPDQEVSLHSIDTGNDANLFQEHYFSMNRDHTEGIL